MKEVFPLWLVLEEFFGKVVSFIFPWERRNEEDGSEPRLPQYFAAMMARRYGSCEGGEYFGFGWRAR